MITNSDLTLYKRVYVGGKYGYKKEFIYGVNWQDVAKVVSGQNGLVYANVTEIFIPLSEGIEIKTEDLIVRGLINDAIDESHPLKDLQKKYDVKVVMAVGLMDNGSPDIQHLEVTAT